MATALATTATTGAADSPGLSAGTNFAWTLAGDVVYLACLWGVVVVLARLGTPVMIGQYSLGVAIITPLLMLTNLQLRLVQSADVRCEWPFSNYLGLRLLTSSLAVSILVLAMLLLRVEPAVKLVIVLIAIFKGIDSISDVCHGLFQKNDKLDYLSQSVMGRGLLALTGITVAIAATRNLRWGVMALMASSLMVLMLFDLPRAASFVGWAGTRPCFRLRNAAALAKLTLPLGVAMMLTSFNTNVPRYFIQYQFDAERLGIFSALAYTSVGATIVVDALGASLTARLARHFAAARFAEFYSLARVFLGISLVPGCAGMALAIFAGRPLLTLLYGPLYAAHADVFVWIMVAALFTCVASMLTYTLTAVKRFRSQVPLLGLVAGSSVLGSALLVPVAGLRGGAMASALAAIVQILGASVILWRALRAARLQTCPG